VSGPSYITPSTEQIHSVFLLHREDPALTAGIVMTRAQKFLLILLLLAAVAGLIMKPLLTLILVNGAFLTFYLGLCLFKIVLINLSLGRTTQLSFTTDDLEALSDEELPVYTILVPLYHESESLPRLISALERLDYPKEKLDAILLLEEDDSETQLALQELQVPGFVRALIVPDQQPKTKPKACNLGLAVARGEYLVIYDAEDRPEPDQLKKAVLGFRQCAPDVVCLQARLNFYNQRQNLLTRWFTTDYSVWFDLYLPGLDHIKAPVPLGGTSNHFITEKLRELRGWDPFNVTEDADLGVRLALRGYLTRMIDSTTWEEACSHLGYWIRQRSRWTKGYVQTYLVHMRRWASLLRRVGPMRWLSFQFMVGGTPLSLLINPIYWILTLVWFSLRWESLSLLFPFPLILFGLLCLFIGNFVFIYSAVLATYRRGYYDIVRYALIVPLYWVVMSIGGWKGFLQLITRPSYWEKTRHGFDLQAQGATPTK